MDYDDIRKRSDTIDELQPAVREPSKHACLPIGLDLRPQEWIRYLQVRAEHNHGCEHAKSAV